MIGLSTTQRYYLYRHPTDMRKSLCAMNAGNSNANYEMRDRPLGTGRWMLVSNRCMQHYLRDGVVSDTFKSQN